MILYLADQKKQWLRKIVGIAIAVVFILKFLFGTLVGVLLLVSLLYYYSFYWLGVHPWTFGQLIFWFFELSDEAKIGLTSSLVTVFGFFIALHSTMHSWRQQTATASRMSAADDIDQIISEVGSKILQVQLFSERTAHEVLRIRTFT